MATFTTNFLKTTTAQRAAITSTFAVSSAYWLNDCRANVNIITERLDSGMVLASMLVNDICLESRLVTPNGGVTVA